MKHLSVMLRCCVLELSAIGFAKKAVQKYKEMKSFCTFAKSFNKD